MLLKSAPCQHLLFLRFFAQERLVRNADLYSAVSPACSRQRSRYIHACDLANALQIENLRYAAIRQSETLRCEESASLATKANCLFRIVLLDEKRNAGN